MTLPETHKPRQEEWGREGGKGGRVEVEGWKGGGWVAVSMRVRYSDQTLGLVASCSCYLPAPSNAGPQMEGWGWRREGEGKKRAWRGWKTEMNMSRWQEICKSLSLFFFSSQKPANESGCVSPCWGGRKEVDRKKNPPLQVRTVADMSSFIHSFIQPLFDMCSCLPA